MTKNRERLGLEKDKESKASNSKMYSECPKMHGSDITMAMRR